MPPVLQESAVTIRRAVRCKAGVRNDEPVSGRSQRTAPKMTMGLKVSTDAVGMLVSRIRNPHPPVSQKANMLPGIDKGTLDTTV